MRASEIAAVTGGRLEGPDVAVRGASQDSRQLRAGMLFVPVVAARDGHDFVGDALAAGAAAYLTSRGHLGGSAVVVDDTTVALRRLAEAARGRLGERVVAVTGSVGKTSTKDLISAVLATRHATHASERSFNNELGVPLTLLNAPEGTEAVVVEMGARGPGHIADLCALARPTVAVVTVVGAAHLELFGTLDDVGRAKGELVEGLDDSGVAVLNADDRRVVAMGVRARGRVLTYGAAGEVRAEALHLDDELRPRFSLTSPWGRTEVILAARGEHNVANALAAAACGMALGVGVDEVGAGLAAARLSPWRMELRVAPSGARILNDAYNANPISMRAALGALARLPARRRTAVLGGMAELGPHAPAAHREVGALARSLGIRVIAVAAPDYGGEDVDDADEALERLGGLGPGDAVLLKASRVAGLERLADRIAATTR